MLFCFEASFGCFFARRRASTWPLCCSVRLVAVCSWQRSSVASGHCFLSMRCPSHPLSPACGSDRIDGDHCAASRSAAQSQSQRAIYSVFGRRGLVPLFFPSSTHDPTGCWRVHAAAGSDWGAWHARVRQCGRWRRTRGGEEWTGSLTLRCVHSTASPPVGGAVSPIAMCSLRWCVVQRAAA